MPVTSKPSANYRAVPITAAPMMTLRVRYTGGANRDSRTQPNAR
jgi:hypothetical protein